MGHPDFLIIGAMKAGTTSLFSWLGSQPEVFVPTIKEPNFFSDDRLWNKGEVWYRELFRGRRPGQIAGEASVAYTDPAYAARAASRIAPLLPDVKLVFVARDPVERLRSHYRHEVLRRRERRRLIDALADPRSPYLARSRYFACLEPYTVSFARDHIRVARFEDLFGPRDEAWLSLLAFLGVDARPRPTAVLNASADRAQFTPTMRAMWDVGLRRSPRFVPPVARRLLRPLLIRSRSSPLLSTADEPLPRAVLTAVWEDTERLEGWLRSPEGL